MLYYKVLILSLESLFFKYVKSDKNFGKNVSIFVVKNFSMRKIRLKSNIIFKKIAFTWGGKTLSAQNKCLTISVKYDETITFGNGSSFVKPVEIFERAYFTGKWI